MLFIDTLFRPLALLQISDEESHKLYLYFLQKAAVPYFSILETWVYKGVIGDPYHEFMVREDLRVCNSPFLFSFLLSFFHSFTSLC